MKPFRYLPLLALLLLATPLLAKAALNAPLPLAFDPSGNLFVGDIGNSNVVEIATSTNAILQTYTGSGFAIAFDHSGNLFSSDPNGSSIDEIATTTGAVIRTYTGSAVLIDPTGIAFDPNGNLWVIESTHGIGNSNSTVLEIATSTDAVLKTYDIAASGSGYSEPLIAFDPNGNLWVALNSSDSSSTGIPTPDLLEVATSTGATIRSYTGSGELNNAGGIAFDQDGNLWVGDEYNGYILEIATSTDAVIQSITPNVVASLPGNLAFDSSGNLFEADQDYADVFEVATSTGDIINTYDGTGPTVPDPPTGVSAAAGSAQAIISFTPPANNGSSSILYYTAASSPGNFTATSTGSPITVSGLTNGMPYTFTVTATNSVGTSASSTPSGSVTPVGTVPSAPQSLTAIASSTQVSLSWSAPASNGGSPLTQYLVYDRFTGSSTFLLYATTTPSQTTSTVTSLTNGQPYDFEILAQNSVGTSTPSNIVSATPASIPAKPTGVTAVAGNAQAQISYVAPLNNGGSAILYYTALSSPGNFQATSTISPITVSGLANGTPYTFTVTATNAIGVSPSSTASGSVTPAASLTGITPTSLPTGTVGVAYSQLLTATGGLAPYAWSVSSGSLPVGLVLATSSANSTTTISGTPTSVSTSNFTVQVSSNGSTTSQSYTVNIIGVPSVPQSFTATPSNGQVSLSWTAPSSNGGSPITSYIVNDKFSASSTYALATSTGPSATSSLITSLTNGTSYDFQILAQNAIGTSTAASVTGVIPATVPGPPTSPSAVAGNAQTTVSFTAPTSNGGSAIVFYTATSNPGSFHASSTGSPIIVSGLTNGTPYNFTVTATNAVGTSVSSTVSGSVTPAASLTGITPTSLPTGTVGVAYSQLLTATGGLAPYTWSISSGSLPAGLVLATSSANSTTTISGTPTTVSTSNFTVQVLSNGSTTSQSYMVNIVGIPSVPQSFTATPGNTQVSLSWTAPSSSGGSPITGYIVNDKLSASSTYALATSTGPSATSAVISSLTNGTSYDFQIVAQNTVGTSTAASVTGVIPATLPGPPTGVAATAGNAQATVSFIAPASNGGSAILYYTAASNPGNFTATSTLSPITVSGLANGTPYNFTVTATNAVGTSVSSTMSGSVTPATVPTAPQFLTATAGSTQVSLGWTIPSSNGGSPLTSYLVAYKLSAGSSFATFATTTPGTTADTVTGLVNGTSYDFEVSAVNAQGASLPAIAPGIVTIAPQQPVVTSPVTVDVGGGGGGGGGGVGFPAPVFPTTVTTPPVTVTTVTTSPSPTLSPQAAGALIIQLEGQLLVDLQAELKILQSELASQPPSSGSQVASSSCVPNPVVPAAQSYASYPFPRDLAPGDQGRDVAVLQEFLIAQDTGSAAQALGVVGATGNFFSLTQQALEEFQASICVPANGSLDAKTIAAMATGL